MSNTFLNLGCSAYKLKGFTNIDIDPEIGPDLCIDLKQLSNHFDENSVDFIFAGHVFEHLPRGDSQRLIEDCWKLLKSHGTLLCIVPDYSKCGDLGIDKAESIILAQGDHKILFNQERLRDMLRQAGFNHAFHIANLSEVPYMLVSNIHDPKPDPWQTAFIALKL